MSMRIRIREAFLYADGANYKSYPNQHSLYTVRCLFVSYLQFLILGKGLITAVAGTLVGQHAAMQGLNKENKKS